MVVKKGLFRFGCTKSAGTGETEQKRKMDPYKEIELRKMFDFSDTVSLTIVDDNDNFVEDVVCASWEEAKQAVSHYENEYQVFF